MNRINSYFILYFLFFIILCSDLKGDGINQIEGNKEQKTRENILYPLEINKKLGFINQDGELIVTPQYRYAHKTTSGIAIGIDDGGTYYLDTNGDILFRTSSVFRNVRKFSDGLLAMRIDNDGKGQLWGFVNKQGEWVIDPIYKVVRDFSEGLACVSFTNMDEGFYIDKNNRSVFGEKRFYGRDFKDGYANVIERHKENFWIERDYGKERIYNRAIGLINKNGELIVSYKYRTDFTYSDGLICFMYFDLERIKNEERGYFGYMDINEKVIIEPQFWLAYRFVEGVAVVSLDGKHYGLINKKKEYIVPPNYKRLSTMSNGLILFSKDRISYGFLHKTGEIAIPAIFSYGSSFDGPLASIRMNDVPGYVNKEGKYFLSTDYM